MCTHSLRSSRTAWPDVAWIGQVPFEDIGMTEQKMDLMKELAEDNSYWRKAYDFVESIGGRKPSSLTYNQRQWLTTIILDLDDELHNKSWKI